MPKVENAFLLKQRLKSELDKFSSDCKSNLWTLHEDEIQKRDEVKHLLRAGSEILMRRLQNREAEASKMFKQCLSDLGALSEAISSRTNQERMVEYEEWQILKQENKTAKEKQRRFIEKVSLIVLAILVALYTIFYLDCFMEFFELGALGAFAILMIPGIILGCMIRSGWEDSWRDSVS